MSNIITPISPATRGTSTNMQQKMSAYKTNTNNTITPVKPYTPFEEVISVRELLRRLADGKVVLETKIKL